MNKFKRETLIGKIMRYFYSHTFDYIIWNKEKYSVKEELIPYLEKPRKDELFLNRWGILGLIVLNIIVLDYNIYLASAIIIGFGLGYLYLMDRVHKPIPENLEDYLVPYVKK